MMNRLAWLAVGAVVTGSALSGVVGGCSTPPAPVDPPEEDASTGTLVKPGGSTTSSTSSSGSTTSSSGSTGTVPPLPDAAVTQAIKATPLQVSCGAANTLCAAGSRCCWPNFQSATGKCVPLDSADGCGAGEALDLQCDDKTDCPTEGEKCCLGFGETVCDEDCVGNQNGSTLCRTDAECDPGVKCAERTCTLGDPGDQHVLKLRICGTTAECK